MSGGFDVVLGNPPWDRIKLLEKEWFLISEKRISNAKNVADRRKLILQLKNWDYSLYIEYINAKRKADSETTFFTKSNKYPYTGKGDVNLYALFAELFDTLMSSFGQSGFIVPLGIATDTTYKLYFQYLMESNKLLSLLDFENTKGIFPGVHRNFNFALLSISNIIRNNHAPQFSFFLPPTISEFLSFGYSVVPSIYIDVLKEST